jgi:hypothetical protein
LLRRDLGTCDQLVLVESHIFLFRYNLRRSDQRKTGQNDGPRWRMPPRPQIAKARELGETSPEGKGPGRCPGARHGVSRAP